MKKETRALLKDLENQGFRTREVKKGWQIFPPNQAHGPVTVHATPSDRKALDNFIADLKRVGYKP